jgi:serine/threonine protein kinase
MTQQEFQKRYTYNAATDKLGEGGFGSVFKAYDTYRDRWVALKIAKVTPQYESVRLRREVEMVAKLPIHPNIAYYEECYSFLQMDGEYDFGILQYYEQGNLLRLLKSNTLTLLQKHSIAAQILEGIAFLHNNGIIHRDLKPQNILIVKRGTEFIPKITDFGISKQLDINKSSVFSNSIAGAGTLAYSSPEQLGDRTIRKNTDLWSFGVIVFQMLTGQLPFNTGAHAVTSESGRMELFRQINSGNLPASINNIDESWQTVIRRCLVTDPALRIKNTDEAQSILTVSKSDDFTETRIIDDDISQLDVPTPKPQPVSSPPVTSPPKLPQPPASPSKASKGLIVGIITGLIALIIIAGIMITFFSHDHDHDHNDHEHQEHLIADMFNGTVKNLWVHIYEKKVYLRPTTGKLDTTLFYIVDRVNYIDNPDVNKSGELPPSPVISYFYSGQMKDGFPHGDGSANYNDDKSHYEGNFNKGLRHGKGKRTFPNGSVYTGDYVNDVADGHGDLSYPDGKRYSGSWQNNQPNGFGRYFDAKDKEIVKGIWKDGELQEER